MDARLTKQVGKVAVENVDVDLSVAGQGRRTGEPVGVAVGRRPRLVVVAARQAASRLTVALHETAGPAVAARVVGLKGEDEAMVYLGRQVDVVAQTKVARRRP